ncbi:MAG: cation transporter [Leuconostoc mesenteroides]|jgi:predicted Co/Zn/Cd cation transporter (cation efflux family)|nr:cation transporter [Leuconostoc mesenteroides]
MNQKNIEQRSLVIGCIWLFAMGVAALTAYFSTRLEALFVDAYFTLITLTTGLLSIIISKISTQVSKRFPNGLFVLEPLYAFFQSLMTVSSKAYQYFVYGHGQLLNIAPVIPYEIVMVILSLTLSWFYQLQNKKIHNISTLLSAETKGAMIDGVMSAGIGVAAFFILFIDKKSPLSFLLYTGDSFITVIIVLFIIRIPLRIMKNALIEISGGLTQDQGIKSFIERAIQSHLTTDFSIDDCKIYKVGMSFKACISISSRTDMVDTKKLTTYKKNILNDLSRKISFINIIFIYSNIGEKS